MMQKKTFGFFGMIALLVFSLTLVSATTTSVLTIDNINAPNSANEDTTSFTFTFNVTYTGTSASETIDFSGSTTNFGSVSIPNPTGLDGTVSGGTEVSVTGTVSGYSGQGGNDLVVSLNGSTTSEGFDDEKTVTVSITETINLCPNGEVGDLEISDFNIDNKGTGDDEEWNPLDELEIEVEIENTHNDDSVSDVMVEIFIFDSDENDVTNDFDFEDEEDDRGRIKEDDEEISTFVIKELPADLDEGKYRIYVKAYEDNEEDQNCASESSEFSDDEYHEIEYVREEDVAVVVRDDDVSTRLTAACGEDNVQINFPVYNIGTDKEESVLVNLYNAGLGIDEFYQIDDLRSGKKAGTTFFFDVPETAEERTYKLDVFTYFDYDEDEDVLSEFSYDTNSFDDLNENWQIQLDVIGCSGNTAGGSGSAPTVTASLDSEARVGEELVVRTTVANTGDAGTYLVTATGLEGWAELLSVTPQSLTLGQGGSGEVLVRLRPTTEGFQTFSIETFRNGEMFSQPVSVNIAGEAGVFDGLGERALFYIVGALVILIVIILVLIIVKAGSRRGSNRDF